MLYNAPPTDIPVNTNGLQAGYAASNGVMTGAWAGCRVWSCGHKCWCLKVVTALLARGQLCRGPLPGCDASLCSQLRLLPPPPFLCAGVEGDLQFSVKIGATTGCSVSLHYSECCMRLMASLLD